MLSVFLATPDNERSPPLPQPYLDISTQYHCRYLNPQRWNIVLAVDQMLEITRQNSAAHSIFFFTKGEAVISINATQLPVEGFLPPNETSIKMYKIGV